jgi:hypothetical protein
LKFLLIKVSKLDVLKFIGIKLLRFEGPKIVGFQGFKFEGSGFEISRTILGINVSRYKKFKVNRNQVFEVSKF